jgi:dUTP pyrophosphatase
MTILIGIHRLAHAPEALPAYATPGSAAIDIAAAMDEPITLAPMARYLVPTGFILAIPDGYEVQIRPRSGLSIKHGVTLINAVGTIDADYRHEVKVPLVNLGTEPYTIQPGERIAQLLVAPAYPIQWESLDNQPEQLARAGGFGSTGK